MFYTILLIPYLFDNSLYFTQWFAYKILIPALLLGGPIFCGWDSLNNYTFHEFAQETINVTLCGVPEPTVRWSFNSSLFQIASSQKINNYTFTYLMELPVLTQDICGMELTFKGEGFSDKEVERKLHIFLSNCKFIDLLLILLVHCFF